MRGRWTVLALSGLLGLGGLASAQDETSAGKTVTREEVKSWIFTVDAKEWSVRPATPTTLGDTGLLRLSTAYTLPKGMFSFSLFRDNYDRDPKGTDFSILGLSIGYGATNRLELFGNVGIQNRTKARYLAEAGGPNEYPFISSGWQTGFGDIHVGAKYKLLDDYYYGDPVGLAIRGVVKLPTADEAKALGTGKASFEGDLVLSKSLSRKADLHGNVGYVFNGKPDPPSGFPAGDYVANSFHWGVGLDVPACRLFQLEAEVTGDAYGNTTVKQTNTADLLLGATVWIKSGWFLRPGYSYALNYDGRGRNVSTAKRDGFQVAVGYHGGTPCCEIYTPPPPPPPPTNRPPTVSATCESPVLPGAVSKCRATASDPDGDPLTYAWTSGGGQISGSNAEASLDTAGIQPGDCAPVTVKVSDGRGGTAEGSARVCVQAPPKPKPEAVTCTSGGFPRNLSRLNNVDKACLDDVASKLRQDPRSRVVIVGHADSSERHPEVVGRTRAEAVKTYLVKERGIEEARITAKSAADRKPLDTANTVQARAKNRRVEVIFVPEGATVPEDDD
jgi:outer membrane protein OmpA-like peptidoglycan-associated protein